MIYLEGFVYFVLCQKKAIATILNFKANLKKPDKIKRYQENLIFLTEVFEQRYCHSFNSFIDLLITSFSSIENILK